MNVRLVTTWNAACGIAEHSAMLKEAVEADDPSIQICPDERALDPADFFAGLDWANTNRPDLLHLNYHAALHSRWDRDAVAEAKLRGLKIVLTYHDTIGEMSPAALRERGDHRLDRLEAIAPLADALVVHEPCEGFPEALVWSMGVPAWQAPILFASRSVAGQPRETAWKVTPYDAPSVCFKDWDAQPVLGSIGLPFPWKNYEWLANTTRHLGWALLLIAPGASLAQVQQWRELNPASYVRTDFVPRREALSLLTGCDATAFPYTCANTAQSAAILQGIATRKPVFALSSCRQFRGLLLDPLGNQAIRWSDTLDGLAFRLTTDCPITRADPATVALAEQESWTRYGRKYAVLYRTVAGR